VSDDPRPADLAHRLDRLFDEVRPAGGGRRYTNEEVAVAVKALNPHVRVGGAYLSALRNGTKSKPSTELLAALARHFGVPINYFFDEETPAARAAGAEGELARLADNTQVRQLALRALDLTPEGLAEVTELIERVLADQGRLPDDPRRTTASE